MVLRVGVAVAIGRMVTAAAVAAISDAVAAVAGVVSASAAVISSAAAMVPTAAAVASATAAAVTSAATAAMTAARIGISRVDRKDDQCNDCRSARKPLFHVCSPRKVFLLVAESEPQKRREFANRQPPLLGNRSFSVTAFHGGSQHSALFFRGRSLNQEKSCSLAATGGTMPILAGAAASILRESEFDPTAGRFARFDDEQIALFLESLGVKVVGVGRTGLVFQAKPRLIFRRVENQVVELLARRERDFQMRLAEIDHRRMRRIDAIVNVVANKAFQRSGLAGVVVRMAGQIEQFARRQHVGRRFHDVRGRNRHERVFPRPLIEKPGVEGKAIRNRLVSLAVVDRVGPADRIVRGLDRQFDCMRERKELVLLGARGKREAEAQGRCRFCCRRYLCRHPCHAALCTRPCRKLPCSLGGNENFCPSNVNVAARARGSASDKAPARRT